MRDPLSYAKPRPTDPGNDPIDALGVVALSVLCIFALIGIGVVALVVLT